ncbi:hypothetical protein ACPPVQ_11555 [Diaminobutyricibacter sp. McL0618]|uniref:hypothetical protein n=1 Tax=Leifsonia sp. McL0618 TaxID=3415677 RepID=UPI003CE9D7BD
MTSDAPTPAGPQQSQFSVSATAGFAIACAAFLIAFTAGLFPAVLVGVLGLIVSIWGCTDRTRRGRPFAIAGIVIASAAIAQGLLETLLSGGHG